MSSNKEIVDYEKYLDQSEKLVKSYINIFDYKNAFYTLISVLSNFPLFKNFCQSFNEGQSL